MSHNWSATKQRLHPQSAAEISRHSVLSGTWFDNMRHRLGLATRTQISVCNSPFPSAGTAVSLFRAKAVQQRPLLLPREVEWYEQFLQVGRLYRASILLDVTCSVSSKCLCIFSLHGVIYIFKNGVILFTLFLVSWAWWYSPIVSQCYDIVGWSIWCIKSSPKWLTMCLVGR